MPGDVLMERAASGVAEICLSLLRAAEYSMPRVLVVAGKGNNGGDGFAVGRLLHQWGFHVDVWLCANREEVSGDALIHLQRLQDTGLSVREMASVDPWQDAASTCRVDLVVDALLGTGFSGEPHGGVAEAIRFVNRLADKALVVSVDIPSGFPADEGQPPGICVCADRTVSLGLPKLGFTVCGAAAYTGSIDVVDIGIPPSWHTEEEGDAINITVVDEIRDILPPAAWDAHKGSQGKVLLMGGSRRFSGAIQLAARATVRMGAGLTTVLVPESLAPGLAAACPEVMVMGCPESDAGSLDSALWSRWRSLWNDYDACLVGPGMTQEPDTAILVRQILQESKVPLVLDADALFGLRGQLDLLSGADCPVILTPHPGEFARLMEQSVEDVQANREGMAVAASKLTQAVVVLKGAGTIVADGVHSSFNPTGNPALATGGSGDVLAGMITALAARGFGMQDAAKAAVWLHGNAADFASYRHTRAGTRPIDVVEALPYALRLIRPR